MDPEKHGFQDGLNKKIYNNQYFPDSEDYFLYDFGYWLARGANIEVEGVKSSKKFLMAVGYC